MKNKLLFTAVNLDEVNLYKRTALTDGIENFLNGDADAVAVEWRGRYVSAASLANALKKAARTMRAAHSLKIITSRDDVYMIKAHAWTAYNEKTK